MRVSSIVLMMLLTCGVLLAQEPDPNMVVLGGVELCGPVELAIDYMLTPLKGTKLYDLWMSQNEAAPSDMAHGFWLFDKLPVDLAFGGQTPVFAEIMGYHGEVAAVTVEYHNSSPVTNDRTFKAIVSSMKAAKGEPNIENPYEVAWKEGSKLTAVGWSITEDYVKIQSRCEPLMTKIQEDQDKKAQEKMGGVF